MLWWALALVVLLAAWGGCAPEAKAHHGPPHHRHSEYQQPPAFALHLPYVGVHVVIPGYPASPVDYQGAPLARKHYWTPIRDCLFGRYWRVPQTAPIAPADEVPMP